MTVKSKIKETFDWATQHMGVLQQYNQQVFDGDIPDVCVVEQIDGDLSPESHVYAFASGWMKPVWQELGEMTKHLSSELEHKELLYLSRWLRYENAVRDNYVAIDASCADVLDILKIRESTDTLRLLCSGMGTVGMVYTPQEFLKDLQQTSGDEFLHDAEGLNQVWLQSATVALSTLEPSIRSICIHKDSFELNQRVLKGCTDEIFYQLFVLMKEDLGDAGLI